MEREILQKLLEWKDSNRRKPLLLTGVRQCGKTHIIKEFGKRFFKNVCYINFESSGKYAAVFDYDFDVQRIIDELQLLEQTKITDGETLLIFDEIQEAPKAITALKYFCENRRSLHLVCAGSLLGVALKKENISFPVGKVNRMMMYPLNFREFLTACGDEKYINLFSNWAFDREIPAVYSQPLEHRLKEYYIVGGMPEVVNEYINSNNFSSVAQIQDEILEDYADDFSKHAPVSEIEKIRMIWKSVPLQLAKDNNKFVFSHVKEGKRAHELESALQWLSNSGLVHLVQLVKNAQSPLSAFADASNFKVYMSDTGLLCRRLGVGYRNFFDENVSMSQFKGAITENYVLTELLALGIDPYFWRSGNTAELDFVFERDGMPVPVEVKAATNTQAKSYRQFCSKFYPSIGFKLSLKNIAVNVIEKTSTINLPLYLAWCINR